MTDVFPTPPLSPVQPGAYSVLDTSALSAQRGPRRQVVALLGAATGGQPNTPLLVYGETELRSLLRSGSLYDHARLAFAAGSVPVCVVRIGAGIARASLALLNATAGVVLTVTAQGWGAWTNSIRAAADNATGKVTITFTDPLTGVAYTETFTPKTGVAAADLGAHLAAQINGTIPGVAKSSLVTATAGAGAGPLATLAATPLAGGADNGALVAGDWTTGLTALETADVDVIVPASDDATVHAQIVAHCTNMSAAIARKERTAVFGGAAGDSVEQTITRAATTGLTNRRAQLVYPGVQVFDTAGTVVTVASSQAAAVKAGRMVALPDPATSMIHQQLPVIGLEKTLSTVQGGDIDQLLQAGVCALAPAPGGGVWVVDDLCLEPTNPEFRDFPKIRSADLVQRRLRERIEAEWVGKKALAGIEGQIALTARAELDSLKGAQIIVDFLSEQVIVQRDAANPRKFTLTAPVLLVDAVKFVTIVVALQPASTTSALPENA